jgi:OmcA/MtrC family decaheme c-type cytochrome
MRRISLALALVGAVAAAGCGGAGGTSPSSSGGNKGVEQASFKLVVRGENAFWDPVAGTTIILPKGGVVSAPAAGIDCGTSFDVTNAVTVLHKSCEQLVPYSTTPVTVTATPDAARGYGVWGWAGACGGNGACSVTMTDTKFIGVRFAANSGGLGAHINFTDPAIHSVEFGKWQANTPPFYKCTDCHGSTLQGAGLAPSCKLCHATASKKTGLVATIDAVNVTTTPLQVTFHLTDKNGQPVDLSGANGKNTPIGNAGPPTSAPSGTPPATTGGTNTTIGFALGNFSSVNGIASPNTILGYPALGSSPSILGVTKLNDPTNVTKGLLVQTTPGHYTYTFPSQVQILSTNLGNTHTLFMYVTRQEDVSGGACTAPGPGFNPFSSCPSSADDATTFTAVNVIYNFDPNTGAASPNTRDIVNPQNCWNCHNGFKPKGTVSSQFHNGQRVDGRICNVCHNPARTSNKFANSAQFVHRIHAYVETGMAPFYCVDTNKPGWDVVGLSTMGVPSYAGGGVEVSIPSSLTDASFCNTTVLASLTGVKPVVKAAAFDNTGLDLTYPQDLRNCDACHGNAAQGSQYNTNPSPIACNSCHGGTSTIGSTTYGFKYWYGSQGAVDGEMQGYGTFIPGFVQGAANEAANIQMAHPKLAVSPPDPQGCLLQDGNQPAGCNANTNAAYLANAGQVPVGADTWGYSISNVQLDASGHPQVTFQILRNGTAIGPDYCNSITVGSQTDPTVIFANTYGGPSVYAAFSVPQDGITAPADFNATVSGYLPAICNEGKTAYKGTNTASVTVDASNNWTVTFTYTANLSGQGISMLTGGIGYTYNPSSTPPITQTNVMGPYGVQYPVKTYNITGPTTPAPGTKVYGVACTPASPCTVKTGGLIVPAKDATMVAPGYTGRRVIVDNALCDKCHARIGAKPTFHAGQRNDAPTCSFCHTANQGSGGWTANASNFVHAIHGAEKRTVPFTWEGSCNVGSTWTPAVQTVNPPTTYYANGDCRDGSGNVVAPRFYYPEVTYPGILACTECHVSNFMAPATAAAASLLWPTTAYGTAAYGNNPNTAPYVNPTTVYGAGFSFDAKGGAATAAAGTTLVDSPMAAACFSCHDDASTHMAAFGGQIYQPRSSAMATKEQCLTCHGAGAGLDAAIVHPQ